MGYSLDFRKHVLTVKDDEGWPIMRRHCALKLVRQALFVGTAVLRQRQQETNLQLR